MKNGAVGKFAAKNKTRKEIAQSGVVRGSEESDREGGALRGAEVTRPRRIQGEGERVATGRASQAVAVCRIAINYAEALSERVE